MPEPSIEALAVAQDIAASITGVTAPYANDPRLDQISRALAPRTPVELPQDVITNFITKLALKLDESLEVDVISSNMGEFGKRVANARERAATAIGIPKSQLDAWDAALLTEDGIDTSLSDSILPVEQQVLIGLKRRELIDQAKEGLTGRTFRIGYDPPRAIQEAGQEAGVPSHLLRTRIPMKVTYEICEGKVERFQDGIPALPVLGGIDPIDLRQSGPDLTM